MVMQKPQQIDKQLLQNERPFYVKHNGKYIYDGDWDLCRLVRDICGGQIIAKSNERIMR